MIDFKTFLWRHFWDVKTILTAHMGLCAIRWEFAHTASVAFYDDGILIVEKMRVFVVQASNFSELKVIEFLWGRYFWELLRIGVICCNWWFILVIWWESAVIFYFSKNIIVRFLLRKVFKVGCIRRRVRSWNLILVLIWWVLFWFIVVASVG